MKITIKDKEIEIKNKMRAYLIYEQITDKAFNPKTLTEILIYLYSLILANDKDIELTFTEFMDYIDEHEELIQQFYEWIYKQSEIKDPLTKVKKKKASH